MNRKIIIEEHKDRRLYQRVTLWEESNGEVICRKFFLKDSHHKRNNKTDRINIRNKVFSFTLGEVMETSLDLVIQKMKDDYQETLEYNEMLFIEQVEAEVSFFDKPKIKIIENFEYEIK